MTKVQIRLFKHKLAGSSLAKVKNKERAKRSGVVINGGVMNGLSMNMVLHLKGLIATQIPNIRIVTAKRRPIRILGTRRRLIRRRCSVITTEIMVILHLSGFNKESSSEDEDAKLAQEENSNEDQVLLLATMTNDHESDNNWYLDTGCSNHMTGNKE